MLNPIFSVSHMRHMMPMFYNVGHKVRAPSAPRCGLSSYRICTDRNASSSPDDSPSRLGFHSWCCTYPQLRDAIEQRASGAPAEIDMLNWMGRTALELIGQAGLGYSFDPLKDDETPDVYAEAIKQYVSVSDPHLCR